MNDFFNPDKAGRLLKISVADIIEEIKVEFTSKRLFVNNCKSEKSFLCKDFFFFTFFLFFGHY